MSEDAKPGSVPCPNCDGEGFLNDAGSVGLTTPCPVCLTEGTLPEKDAVRKERGAVPGKRPPPQPR
ncbi:MAG: hypothetical protein Q7T05_01395 [Dehalococcoidia bacterium]|nr:hypothetical protein [Dehalococcoidia bacterium]